MYLIESESQTLTASPRLRDHPDQAGTGAYPQDNADGTSHLTPARGLLTSIPRMA